MIDGVNACVACGRCGCLLPGSREQISAALELRTRFESEYLGGLARAIFKKESGNGSLPSIYWSFPADAPSSETPYRGARSTRIVFAAIAILTALALVVSIIHR